MRVTMFVATGWMLAALAAGCGGDDSDNSGGADGGSTNNTCSPPQCFLDVMAACMPDGACATSSSGDITTGAVSNACYANGVKWSTTISTGTSGMTSHMDGYQADGSACFTADGTTDANGNTTEYKDTSGHTVVTVTAGLTDGKMTYSCGGKTYVVDPSTCPKGDGGSSCSPGSCTVP